MLHGHIQVWLHSTILANVNLQCLSMQYNVIIDSYKIVRNTFDQLNRSMFDMELKLIPVDGSWTSWASWASCSETCGGGVQSRTRSCSNPAPQYGGANCVGMSSSTQQCNTQNCPSTFSFINCKKMFIIKHIRFLLLGVFFSLFSKLKVVLYYSCYILFS